MTAERIYPDSDLYQRITRAVAARDNAALDAMGLKSVTFERSKHGDCLVVEYR